MGISPKTIAGVRNRLIRHKERRMGVTKKKALLLLLGGLSLGLSGSPRTSWKIIGEMIKEWKELNRQVAERAINSLFASRLVDTKENKDGTFTLILSEKGKRKALTYDLVKMRVEKPTKWDRMWRLISFDVPVDKKEVRDSLREQLLRLGFYELHQSLFIHPFDCFKEITYIIELYDAHAYVRFASLNYIDNEVELRRFFKIT